MWDKTRWILFSIVASAPSWCAAAHWMSEQLNFYSCFCLPTLLKPLLLLLPMHHSVPNGMYSSQKKKKKIKPNIPAASDTETVHSLGFRDDTISWIFSFPSGYSFISILHLTSLPIPKVPFLQLLVPERPTTPIAHSSQLQGLINSPNSWGAPSPGFTSNSTKFKSASQLSPMQTKPQTIFC